MDRREFLKVMTNTLITFWGIALMYPLVSYLKKPEDPSEKQEKEVIVGKSSDFKAGDGKAFKFGHRPAMLICDSSGNFHAFDATCSHLGCTAQYRKEQKDIFCACHGGVYDLNGKNVSGPPPKPLIAYQVSVKNGQVIVKKA